MFLGLRPFKLFAHRTACLHTRYTSGLQLQLYHPNVHDFVNNYMCSCQRFAAAAQVSPVGLSALLSCGTLCAQKLRSHLAARGPARWLSPLATWLAISQSSGHIAVEVLIQQ